MSKYSVQFGELQHTVGELHSLAGELQHVTAHPPNLYGHSGSPEVDKAVDSFFSEWTQGMNKTRQNIDNLAGALGQATTAYTRTENGVAHCAGGKAGG